MGDFEPNQDVAGIPPRRENFSHHFFARWLGFLCFNTWGWGKKTPSPTRNDTLWKSNKSLAGKCTLNEDAFLIKNGDIPATATFTSGYFVHGTVSSSQAAETTTEPDTESAGGGLASAVSDVASSAETQMDLLGGWAVRTWRAVVIGSPPLKKAIFMAIWKGNKPT